MTLPEGWSRETPTEPGLYWVLGEAGGYPAVSLFKVYSRALRPDLKSGLGTETPQERATRLASFIASFTLHYRRVDMPGCLAYPYPPRHAIAWKECEKPDPDELHAEIFRRNNG